MEAERAAVEKMFEELGTSPKEGELKASLEREVALEKELRKKEAVISQLRFSLATSSQVLGCPGVNEANFPGDREPIPRPQPENALITMHLLRQWLCLLISQCFCLREFFQELWFLIVSLGERLAKWSLSVRSCMRRAHDPNWTESPLSRNSALGNKIMITQSTHV